MANLYDAYRQRKTGTSAGTGSSGGSVYTTYQQRKQSLGRQQQQQATKQTQVQKISESQDLISKQDPNKVVGYINGRPYNFAGDFIDEPKKETRGTGKLKGFDRIKADISNTISNIGDFSFGSVRERVSQDLSESKQATKKNIEKLEIQNLDAKKLGKFVVAGAKQVPSQVKIGGGVIIEGIIDMQNKMDEFYRGAGIFKPILAVTPIGINAVAEDALPFERQREVQEQKTLDYAKGLRERGFQESQQKREEFAKTTTATDSGLQKYLEMVVYNLPQVATTTSLTIATALVTKNPVLTTTVGLGTSYGLGASEVYDEARAFGLSDQEATPLAEIGGVIIGALDFIPLERLVRKSGATEAVEKSIVRKIVSKIVSIGTQAGWEGITEGGQEIVGNAIRQTYDENQDLFDEGVTDAMVVGALLGGVSDATLSGIMGLAPGTPTPEIPENINTRLNEILDTPESQRTELEQAVVDEILSTELTPDQVVAFVVNNEIEETSEGAFLLKKSAEATKAQQNLVISTEEKSNAISVELVDPTRIVDNSQEREEFKKTTREEREAQVKKEVEPEAKDVAKATPQKIEGYEIGEPRDYQIIEQGGVTRTIEGIPVKIADGIETFLREGDGGWVVSEATTGRYISESRTKGGAIAKADTIIGLRGAEKVQKAIAENQLSTTEGAENVQEKEADSPTPPEKKAKSKAKKKKTTKRAGREVKRGKPKTIKLEKLTPDKKATFKTKDRNQLQAKVRDVARGMKADSQEQAVEQIGSFIDEQLSNTDDPLYDRKLKAVRAELKRQMYELVGANTGNWKRDFAYFQTMRNDPDFNLMVDKMEDAILQIDEAVNANAPSTSLGHASSGSISIGNFEQRSEPRQGTREFKLYEKSKELTTKYAQLVGEGYTPRRALGVYYRKTKNIRVNAINNLSTVAHEVTHFLDHQYNISDKLMAIKGYSKNGNPIYDSATLQHRKEMTDLYTKYYPGGKKTHSLRKRTLEGFATLLQKYVESPNRITDEYPMLVKDFLEVGGKYYQPVMGEIVKDLNSIVDEYQGLKPLDKIGSKVTSDAINADKPSFMNFREKLRTFLADEIYPVEVLAKRFGTQLTKEDPSLWLRAYNNIAGVINNNISTDRGYWTFAGDGIKKVYDFNWKTLVDLTTENKNTDDFGYYLVARREYFAYQELDVLRKRAEEAVQTAKETPKADRDAINSEGLTVLEVAKQAVENYQALRDVLRKDGFTRTEVEKAYNENKDRFTEEEKMFDKLTRADLDLMASEPVQLITPKQHRELTSKEGYASFKREFYDDIVGDNGEITGSQRVGKTKVSSILRRKGSERTIINPLYNGITNHSEIVRKSTKQVVYNKLADIGTSAMFPDLFQELDLVTTKDERTGAILYPQERDPNIIMGRQNYKRKPVLVDGEIKNAVDKILTYDNVDTFVKLYTGLSRMFTAGTTGFYPQFTATNLLRDQITAQANTTNKYKALYTPIKEFGAMLRDRDGELGQYYQEYMIMGGERQTFTGWQKLPPKKLFERVNGEKKALEKAISWGEKATDVLSTPAKYSEIISRFGEYANSRKAGKPPIVALEEAGRVTAPFHHIGTWGGKYGQTFIRGLPFFNASLQVLDQHIRTAQTPEGRRRLAFVTMAITASYLASIMAVLNASDDQKEQYKDLHPEDLAKFIYFPHPSGEKLIRVPMSDVFTPLGTVVNMIIADEVLGTEYKAIDYWRASTSWIPDQFDITEPVKMFFAWMPQVFQAGAETIIGVRTYPEVSPLEGMSLKNLPPGLRSTENTSKFAKWLGQKINISPVKIDHFITGYFGRATGLVTGKPSAWDWDSSIIRDYWFGYGRRVDGAYKLKEENDQRYNNYQRGGEDLNKDDARELYRKYVLTRRFSDLMGDYREVDIEKDPEKASDIRNQALEVMTMIDNGDEPTPEQWRRMGFPKSYKSFNDWVKEADDRRDEKIEEIQDGKTSSKTVLESIAGVIGNIQLVPEVSADEGEKEIKSMSIEGDRVLTFYKDGSYTNKAITGTKSKGLLSTFGKILNDVGTKLGLEEHNLSEKLGYKNADQERQELVEFANQINGKINIKIGEIREKADSPFTDEKPEEKTSDNDVLRARSGGEGQKVKEVDVPQDISDTIREVFGTIAQEAVDVLHHPYGEQKLGFGHGENAQFKVDNIDIPNTNEDGSIKQIYNPFTDSKEDSIDRGLFRINNETFYTYLNGKEERKKMKKAGIIDSTNLSKIDWKEAWDRMNELEHNTNMAKIIYDKQGWGAWFASPAELSN